jgi:HD-like signal output (HDOD) protein
MSNLALTIEKELSTAAEQDELDLPTLPEVALKIRETAGDRDVSVQRLAKVIAADPALSAQLIKIANSPMFRAVRPIEDLTHAISRMGVVYAANLATGLAMKHMFQATSDVIDRKMRSIWTHATDVAAVAGVLASSFTDLAPDEATLGGLTHSIGALPILSWAEEHEELFPDEATLDRVITSAQGSIGTMILTNWNFPPELACIPTAIRSYDREIADIDFVDVVQISELQVIIGTDHPLNQLDWSQISGFARMGFDPDEARETLDSFRDAFQMARELYR